MVRRARLFCSTKHGDQLAPPLPAANLILRFHDFDIWSVQMQIADFLTEVRVLLNQRALVSACIFYDVPSKGKEWMFVEWFGRLLVDLDLVSEIFQRSAEDWRRTQVSEELNLAIFAPTESPLSDFKAQAVRYRNLLDNNREGEVTLRREWIETRNAQESLFGRYADPRVGGAIALLSLSGAASNDVEQFVLRTPAALDLEIDRAPESLIAESSPKTLTIRCIGCSQLTDLDRNAAFETSRDRWAHLHAEICELSPAAYFIALELDAARDPTIVIPQGTVFEQQSLIGVQTLATTNKLHTVVDIGEVKPLIIPAYCLKPRT